MRLLRCVKRARAASWALAALLLACRSEPEGREDTGLEALGLTEVSPRLVLPGTTLRVDGRSFLPRDYGTSWLRLEGTYAGTVVDAYLLAEFVDFDELRIDVTPMIIGGLGPSSGTFSGRAQVVVDYLEGGRYASVPLTSFTLEIAEHLEPELDDVSAGPTIWVNEPIEVHGEGLLLGGDEGTTYAVVAGCFALAEGDGQCLPVAPVEVPVTPAEPFDRQHGTFAFVPRIAGIRAGRFEGTVRLQNRHANDHVTESADRPIDYDLAETFVDRVGDDEPARIGRWVPIGGGGFVETGDGGGTVLRFSGEYQADDGEVLPLDFEIVPDFVDGRTVRYVVNEQDALSGAIDVRYAQGTFVGTVEPLVDWGGQQVVGQPAAVSFRLEPVRQVVVLQYTTAYVETLRLFGLRALDTQIRDRVREVLRRDYAGVNVEIRDELPEDYELYSTLEIGGPDPNGEGLLGFDNTHGKDTRNLRLDDKIGGVNAQTLESGQPGFGGVFMESLFSFSLHPPAGTVASSTELAHPEFDRIFDPFRPDRGQPVSTTELVGFTLPALESSAQCWDTNRYTQMACAVFVLGSVVGSTVSHELAHSLGLADPYGSKFHDIGNKDNRLMEQGSDRDFLERAELQGRGPSRFCAEQYEYLREILPSTEPAPDVDRESCSE